MENTNVNTEMNQQPAEIANDNESKVPQAYQKWYKMVESECTKARELANETAENHVSETNKLLFMFFNRGYTLGIKITKSELSVYQLLGNGKTNTLTSFPIPYYELVPLSKIARREFFNIYIQRMNAEYGDFRAYEMHVLGPEDYIEDVLPWIKTVPKTKEISKNTNNSNSGPANAEPDDDIELIFSRRPQKQQ